MSIDCPPKRHPSPLSPHEVVPTSPPAVANENYGNLLDYTRCHRFRRTETSKWPVWQAWLFASENGERGILSWLGRLLVASVLVGTAPATWSGDIRVGFINPTAP